MTMFYFIIAICEACRKAHSKTPDVEMKKEGEESSHEQKTKKGKESSCEQVLKSLSLAQK